MQKFKVGDKVVVLSGHGLSLDQRNLVGKASTIIKVDRYYETDDYTIGYDEQELMLESIYNSSLYKILEET